MSRALKDRIANEYREAVKGIMFEMLKDKFEVIDEFGIYKDIPNIENIRREAIEAYGELGGAIEKLKNIEQKIQSSKMNHWT